MSFITYAELKSRVQKRLDLEEEVFIQEDEYQEYTRDAISFVESIIHKFRADDVYFESVAPIALVDGQEDYALPDNIYGNKIRKIIYTKNDDIFEIKRMTRKDRYIDAALRVNFFQTTIYMYMLLNQDPRTGPRVRLSPASQENTTQITTTVGLTIDSATITCADTTDLAVGMFAQIDGVPNGAKIVSIVDNISVTLSVPAYETTASVAGVFTSPDVLVYYIREANIPSSDDDLIDIPEWYQIVQQFVVVQCLKKEPNNPRFETEKAELDGYIVAMEAALSNMIPDQEDLIEVDANIYWEMS